MIIQILLSLLDAALINILKYLLTQHFKILNYTSGARNNNKVLHQIINMLHLISELSSFHIYTQFSYWMKESFLGQALIVACHSQDFIVKC